MRAFIAAVAALALAGSARAADPPNKPVFNGRPVDLVLCLDTSNSMDGLILSAKAKLWDVVNTFARVKPVPDLRVAVYSYGNDSHEAARGWVRQEVAFTRDLDEVSRVLNDLRTRGGTEYVGRVSNSALRELKWSDEAKALKVMFVCGNESAAQDPEIPLALVAGYARERGVLLNTIYCGGADDPDARGYREVAGLAGGKFMHIDQGAVTREKHVPTPFDKELIELGSKSNATCVPYGAKATRDAKVENQAAQDKNAAANAPGGAAARSITKNTGLYRNHDWDLVDRLKDDPKFDCNTLKPEELPDEVRKLPPAERAAYLRGKLDERNKIAKRVAELQKLQADYVAKERAKDKAPATPAAKALDDAIREVIREQAGKAGLELGK